MAPRQGSWPGTTGGMTCACRLLLLLACSGLPAAGQEVPSEPVLEQSFPRGARQVGFFRRAAKGQEAEQAALLFGLASELRTSLALTRELYERRGYFELLASVPAAQPTPEPLLLRPRTLVALHERYAELLNVEGVLWDVASANTFARVYLDARFVLRYEILIDACVDHDELSGAIALSLARARGIDAQEEDSAREHALARGDLAAARIKVLLSDLALMYEHPRTAAPESETEVELAAALVAGDFAAVQRITSQHERGIARMRSTLRTPRFDSDHDGLLRARRTSRSSSEVAAAAMRQLLPYTAEGREAAEAIERLGPTERTLRAISAGLEATARNPFDPELARLLAEALDHRNGPRASGGWFERYLALSGIRSWEWSSYGARDLSHDEERALAVVQLTGGR